METREFSLLKTSFEEKSPGFDRLIMLCDGIFAIAMTLLVLDIKLNVPEGAKITDAAMFWQALKPLLLKSLFYLMTFITVAGYWMGHRRLMTYVKRQDGPFTILTFLFLAFVVFFPVSFNVMTEGGDFAAVVIFYTAVLAGCGFSSFSLWAYASWKHRLIDPGVSQHEIVSRSMSILFIPAYFSLSLLLLLIPHLDPDAVFYSWIFIPFFVRLFLFVRSWGEKRLHLEEATAPMPQESKVPVASE